MVALGSVPIGLASCGGGSTDLFAAGDASSTGSGSGAGGSGGGETQDGAAILASTACTSDKECTPKSQLCDVARSVCVDCLVTADCKDGQACVDHACRVSCSSDKDCHAQKQLCDATQMACVDCLTSADCDAPKYCASHACVDRVCNPQTSVCKAGGVATCNAEGSAYGAVATCAADSPCTEASGKASCGGKDAGPITCDAGTTVWFLVSRSGAMFSSKFAEDTTHWAAVLQAFAADGPLKDYAPKIKIGLATFAGEMSPPSCPALVMLAPATDNGAAVLASLTAAERPSKGETPTTAAYAAISTMLQSDSAGSKYIVIMGDAAPDRCTDPSTYCAQDELIQAIQSAYSAGIRTKIIGLPNVFLGQTLWTQFLQDVANAGAGQGVAYTGTVADDFQCNRMFKARYASEGGAPGTSPYSAPASPTELKAAVGTVLGSLGCH